MAVVTYDCNKCGNFWFKGKGETCSKCGSQAVNTDWDEKYDSEAIFNDVADDYDELPDTEDNREMLLGVFG